MYTYIYIYILWNYQWSLSLSIYISLTGSLDSQTGQRSKLASMTVAFGLDRLLVGGEGYSILEAIDRGRSLRLCVSRPTYLDFRLLGFIALDAILANTLRLPLAAWKRLQVRGRGGTSAASVKSIHTGSGATKTTLRGFTKHILVLWECLHRMTENLPRGTLQPRHRWQCLCLASIPPKMI